MSARLIACCVVIAACSLLAPRPDRTRFFVLAAMPGGDATTVAGAVRRDALIGVGPMTFPSYLRRSPVVTRVGPNSLAFSPTARWAEPVETSLPRVLSRNLSVMLDTDRIVRYPWLPPTRPDYSVAIEVLRFERTVDGDGELAAHVTIRDREGRVLDGHDVRMLERAEGDGIDGSVAALSDAVVGLSREIADTTRRLENARQKTSDKTAGSSFSEATGR